MTADLQGFRRRFLQGLADEEIELRDRQGRTVERRRAADAVDLEAGTFVTRGGWTSIEGRGEPVTVEIGLEELAAEWMDLVLEGREILAMDCDEERAVIVALVTLLDDVIDSGTSRGVTWLVLTQRGFRAPAAS